MIPKTIKKNIQYPSGLPSAIEPNISQSEHGNIDAVQDFL